MKRTQLILGSAVLVLCFSAAQAKTLKSRVVQKPVKVKVKKTVIAPKTVAPQVAAPAVTSPDQLRQTSAAPAPVSGSSQTATPVAATEAKKSPFSMDTILSVSRDLRVTDHPDHSSGMGIELDPVMKLSDQFALIGVFAVSKSFTGDMETQISDTVLGLNYAAIPLDKNKVFGLSPRASLTLPTSEASREVNSLYMGTTGALRLTVSPPDSAFKGYYQPSLTRFFHDYEDTTKGGLNKAWRLRHRVLTSIDLSSKFSLGFLFDFNSIWNYANEVSNDFQADQSLNYQATDHWGFSLSHNTSGDFWNEDRSESKYSLTDPEMATIALSATFSF